MCIIAFSYTIYTIIILHPNNFQNCTILQCLFSWWIKLICLSPSACCVPRAAPWWRRPELAVTLAPPGGGWPPAL